MFNDDEQAVLGQLITRLREQGSVPANTVTLSPGLLNALGIDVSEQAVRWPPGCDPLSASVILSELQARGFRDLVSLDVLPVVGSTNDWLRSQAVNGLSRRVVTAECQLAGKGRLGRQWSTPVGGSIALSLGVRPSGR